MQAIDNEEGEKEEDFATFIANQRLRQTRVKNGSRKIPERQDTVPKVPPSKLTARVEVARDKAASYRSSNGENKDLKHPTEKTQRGHNMISNPRPAIAGREEVSANLQLQNFSFDSDGFNAASDDETPSRSPIRYYSDSQISRFFVEQDLNSASTPTPTFQSTRSREVGRLLPIEYDSETESVQPRKAGVPPGPPSHISKLATRAEVVGNLSMRPSFANKDYLNLIKQNPYTSGLFEYQKSSGKDMINRARHNKARAHQFVDEGAAVANVSQHQQNTPMSAHFNPNTHFQPSQIPPKKRRRLELARPAVSIPVSENNILCPVVPQRLGTPNGSAAVDIRPPSHLSHVQKSDRAQSPCVSSPDVATLLAFLHQNALRYRNGLSKLDCWYTRDSEEWRVLERQIQPHLDKFVNQLDRRHNLSIDEFITSLQAWDMDLGVQVILQKYLMYTALLKKIET